MPDVATPNDVLAFWRALGAERWFAKHTEVDAEIGRRFNATYESAAAGLLADWEEAAETALALLIVLDQFPRNMFRGAPRAFAADPLARAVAGRAIARGLDAAVARAERGFFYLPYMHSEDLADQERCVALFRVSGDANGLKFAELHAEVIRRFGRFPHRNAALGRATMPDEQAFLDAGGFAG
jgi:uncharacterized protein (DUF924 family)